MRVVVAAAVLRVQSQVRLTVKVWWSTTVLRHASPTTRLAPLALRVGEKRHDEEGFNPV